MNSIMDFNELGAQVLEELKAGKPLFGFSPIVGEYHQCGLGR